MTDVVYTYIKSKMIESNIMYRDNVATNVNDIALPRPRSYILSPRGENAETRCPSRKSNPLYTEESLLLPAPT
jgi:hypothetical protein